MRFILIIICIVLGSNLNKVECKSFFGEYTIDLDKGSNLNKVECK